MKVENQSKEERTQNVEERTQNVEERTQNVEERTQNVEERTQNVEERPMRRSYYLTKKDKRKAETEIIPFLLPYIEAALREQHCAQKALRKHFDTPYTRIRFKCLSKPPILWYAIDQCVSILAREI